MTTVSNTVLKGARANFDQASAPVSDPQVVETVAQVIADVRADGDAAVRRYSEKFDRWTPDSFRLGAAQVEAVVKSMPTTVLDDIRFVQRQVANFAQAQRDSLTDI